MQRLRDWLYLFADLILFAVYLHFLLNFNPNDFYPPAVWAYLILLLGTFGTAVMFVWYLWEMYHDKD